MIRRHILKTITALLTLIIFGGGIVFFSIGDTWCSELQGGMGVPQELADQINNSNGGAGLNSANTTDLEATLRAMDQQFYSSHPEYGITIANDDGTVPSQPQTTAPTTQPATSNTQSKSDTKAEKKAAETTNEKTEEKEPEEEVHEHVYQDRVTKQPTCTEPGETTFSCECGDSYTEEIPATGHEPGEWETETEATCTTEGKKVVKCTKCGEVLKEEVIPARGHSEGDWEVVKEATWTQNGQMVTKCTVCGEVINTKEIPANTTPLYIIGGCIAGAVILIIIVIILVRNKKRRK